MKSKIITLYIVLILALLGMNLYLSDSILKIGWSSFGAIVSSAITKILGIIVCAILSYLTLKIFKLCLKETRKEIGLSLKIFSIILTFMAYFLIFFYLNNFVLFKYYSFKTNVFMGTMNENPSDYLQITKNYSDKRIPLNQIRDYPFLVVSDSATPNIYCYDSSQNDLTPTDIDVSSFLSTVVLSPDKKKLAYSKTSPNYQQTKITVYDESGESWQIVAGKNNIHIRDEVTFSPDGRSLVLAFDNPYTSNFYDYSQYSFSLAVVNLQDTKFKFGSEKEMIQEFNLLSPTESVETSVAAVGFENSFVEESISLGSVRQITINWTEGYRKGKNEIWFSDSSTGERKKLLEENEINFLLIEDRYLPGLGD